MRRYVLLLCSGCLAVPGSVVSLNYLVDPYVTHQWDSAAVMRLRPPQEKLSAWGKTYAVSRYRPTVVYLGNSRTELGLPAPAPMFAGRAVFNGALSGATLREGIAMARHASRFAQLHTVVWGLDAPTFSLTVGNSDVQADLLAEGPGYALRRTLLDFKRALSVDMTLATASLLAGRFGAVCRSSLAFHGQRDDDCIRDKLQGWRSTAATARPRIEEFVRGDGPTPAALAAFDAQVAALCRAGTRVLLYTNPTHATTIDALYWAGKGPAMERWLADLTALAARHRASGCTVRLVDFAGFNRVTTDPMPPAGSGATMRYYWEPSHYRANVGRMVLARVTATAQGPEGDDFGAELTPAMLPAHLERMRNALLRYRRERPAETALAREIGTRQRPSVGAGG